MYANEDCKRRTDSVQCGLENYGKGSINWAFGPDHGTTPGAFKGANWKAMGEVGKTSTYANDGLMVGVITWTEPGAVRDPHWHNNAAEFGYLISGEVRITVVGLPKTDLAYDASSKTIDHSDGHLRRSSFVLEMRSILPLATIIILKIYRKSQSCLHSSIQRTFKHSTHHKY